MHSFHSTNWWWLLRRVLQHWAGCAAGAGQPVVVEVVDAALLAGRWDSLMQDPGLCTSFTVAARSGRCSGRRCGLRDELGAVAGRRCEPLRCAASCCAALRAASCELRAAAPRCSGLVAPSGTRGLGNPAAVKRF